MNNCQIKELVSSCLNTIKNDNSKIIDEKLSAINSDDINIIIAEALGIVLDTMYSTISRTITEVLCEYNKN